MFLLVFFQGIGFQIQPTAGEQKSTKNINHFIYSHKILSYFIEGTSIRGEFFSNKEIHVIYTTVKTSSSDKETNPLKTIYSAYVLNAFNSWDNVSLYINNIANWDTMVTPYQICDKGKINNLGVHYSDNSVNKIQTIWGSADCSTTRTDAIDKNVKPALDFNYTFLINLVKNHGSYSTVNSNVNGFSIINTIPIFIIVGIVIRKKKKLLNVKFKHQLMVAIVQFYFLLDRLGV